MNSGYQPLNKSGLIAQQPPTNPGGVSLVEQVRRLGLRDRDVICLPADTPHEVAIEFAANLREAKLGYGCLIVLGDVHALDEAEMNAAGWYRK
ncbi:Uncharacterised protein [Pseudomonas putida]|nr:Uncharacterised protein [Pseudomonas putida]CAB5696345.1 Uncharacterised protein [Pseudomonas putida]CAB5722382.1 Uncharacterised protein [Pseudomonas putida]CAB5724124.1 Uncharacterised protein [Pseudomonas putida]CAC9678962.1 Uncharacterised protein [Pseudomonas putida]